MRNLAIHVERRCGLVTVTLDGEVDAASASSLANALCAAMRLGEHTVVVDALGVTFIDVAGRRAIERDGALAASREGVRYVLLASDAMRRLDRLLDHQATAPAPQSQAA